MEPITISDYSGGLDDNFLSAPNNCFYKADNLFLNDNWKLVTRPGTKVHATRIPGGHRVSGIYINSKPFGNPIVFGKDLVHSESSTGTWTEIVGPASNVACPNKTANDLES